MESRAYDFLRRLTGTPGPSGYESNVAAVWREEAESFADEVTHDVVGNSYARLKNEGAPVVVIEGHIDEIGLLITHVDEQGYLWFDHIGGWDPQVLVGQRIRIAGNESDVFGVIGRKASHILEPEEREKAVKIKDLWIDIGAANRDEALKWVSVGDPGVVHADFLHLTDDLCVSRSMDNRVGAFVALEAVRLLAENRPALDIYAIAAAQEEITFAGAYTSTFKVAPAVAIAIDVTHATDYPGADKKRDGEVKVGGGPVLTRGAVGNPVVYRGLKEAALRLGMDLPTQGAARTSGTDADAMIRTAAGTATGVVSIPNRYMHSPNEVISLSDLTNAARLIAEFVRLITPETDFRP
jgi:putative aminopeptidase FrvX